LVQLVQVSDPVFGVRVPAGIQKMLEQHAELSAPVACMILADDRIATELEHARQTVADDGRTQMPNVHLLCQVNTAIVYHDSLWIRRETNAQPLVAAHRVERRLHGVSRERQVDETWTCDLDFFELVGSGPTAERCCDGS